MSEQSQPAFGTDGQPCGECGAPLAADQRYCLSCGARRVQARAPHLDVLEGGAGLRPFGTPVGAAVPVADTLNARLSRNAPLMGLVGILLVAMLIGVLLGHWAGSDTNTNAAGPTPPPQVISVGAAPAAAAPAPGTAAPVPATPAVPSAKGSGKGAGTSSSGGASGAKPKAASKEVKKLQNLTGKAYQKQVDKLPKTFSTGGKAPPKDNKPAGGGSATQDIG